jgi:hypothetical protein
MRMIRGLIPVLGLAVAGLVAAAGAARTQVTEADIGVNPTFEQTGAGTVSTGGFFSARAFVNSAGDFTGGTVTYGGPGSPQALGYSPGDVAREYGSPLDPSFSDLQSNFPTGDYTFGLTGGTQGPESVTVNYAGGAYSNTPSLTSASYTGLQGLNAADPYTVTFNNMVVSPKANESFIFFSILDASNVAVVNDGFLPSNTTSVPIAGGTLAPGQTYTFELIFDDRITGNDPNGVPIAQFYDSYTGGSFTTAAGSVPEPSTWAMMLIGFAGLGFAGYRGSRKRIVPAIAA